jgi:signal recognition particle subunit SRP9
VQPTRLLICAIQTRYGYRWRHDQGQLILKITDDRTVSVLLEKARANPNSIFSFSKQCIKFRARSAILLNRFDSLNRTLMARMQNRSEPVSLPGQSLAPASAAGVSADGAAKTDGAEPSKGKKKKKGKKK